MTKRTHTRRQRKANARILAACDVCHLCGHPGADAVDHVIPVTLGGPDTAENKRPAHHFEPCPTCGVKCNRVKSGKLAAPTIVRRSGALQR